MNINGYVTDKARKSKAAARKLSCIDTNIKNAALKSMADAILNNEEYILSQNRLDVEKSKKAGMSDALIDRLLLNEKRIKDIADGLIHVSGLSDPVGEVIKMWKRPNGLTIGQVRVPIGVIGIIYESRPNVTADAAGLCLKSGNSVILRGGSDAINSNKAIADILYKSGINAGLPDGWLQFIDIEDHEAVNCMMKLNGLIDVLIPRGGAKLIKSVIENSSVPVIQTGVGNCHVFVDESADFEMAKNIIINAKTQKPGACNAIETILIHKNIAEDFLPFVCSKLKEKNVRIKGCDKTIKIIPYAEKADDGDWAKEFLDYILAVKVVDSIDEAIDHIDKYGTKHSEAIVTNSYENSQRFLKEVDAAAVYVNASTRFTDGGEFGFGAEIGISTQKLHARGPMGLNELTTIKNIIYGNGQIRE
jgi:glutamate-5-semialdehyde dehydrogenase